MENPEKIKPVFSDLTLQILNDYWGSKYLERCHEIRALDGLNKLSDVRMIIFVLEFYSKRKYYIRKRIERNIAKREEEKLRAKLKREAKQKAKEVKNEN